MRRRSEGGRGAGKQVARRVGVEVTEREVRALLKGNFGRGVGSGGEGGGREEGMEGFDRAFIIMAKFPGPAD